MAGQTVRNTSRGFRGLNTKGGYLELGPGETREGVELDDNELASAKRTGYFEFGAKAAKAASAAAPAADTPLPNNVPKLKKIARDEGIDVGNAKTVADITAAIVAGRAAKATIAPPAPPPTPPADDLDNMADDDLRNTVAAITGKPATEYANTERDELLKLARAPA
jgi:pyruvate/2-oxoglutarate dehydrogenase complex dihydrolipoamide acyltransferase (E2) component